MQVENTDFALSAVLDKVGAIIGEAAHRKGLPISIERNAVPLSLRGDPTRLRQALLNYAANAVKFTAEGSIAPVSYTHLDVYKRQVSRTTRPI